MATDHASLTANCYCTYPQAGHRLQQVSEGHGQSKRKKVYLLDKPRLTTRHTKLVPVTEKKKTQTRALSTPGALTFTGNNGPDFTRHQVTHMARLAPIPAPLELLHSVHCNFPHTLQLLSASYSCCAALATYTPNRSHDAAEYQDPKAARRLRLLRCSTQNLPGRSPRHAPRYQSCWHS